RAARAAAPRAPSAPLQSPQPSLPPYALAPGRASGLLIALLVTLEPVSPRRHDQLRRSLRVEIVDLAEIVDRLLGEILARDDPAASELVRELAVHALEVQQVLGGLRLVDGLLADDGLRDQHVTRTRTQLVHDLLIELLDREQLARRHVGDLLERREPLLHEDRRDVLVDVELLHEVRDELA